MSRKKLLRFFDNSNNPIILQPGHALYPTLKGQWQNLYFKNFYPLTLELGCGRGEYSISLAKYFPYKNYIGIDIKGDRLWKGAKICKEEKLDNVAFLRIIIQNITQFFGENEVDTIWIPFPDPRPRKKDAKRRLTHRHFLDLYKQILKPKGLIHFKTDDDALFEFSLKEIKSLKPSYFVYSYNYHESELKTNYHCIKTKYENLFMSQGKTIKYLGFRF